jgi:hypothetical protein
MVAIVQSLSVVVTIEIPEQVQTGGSPDLHQREEWGNSLGLLRHETERREQACRPPHHVGLD